MQTVFLIEPLTNQAETWLKENVAAESWNWLGKNLAVEHGYIADIVAGMFEAGFLPCKDFKIN